MILWELLFSFLQIGFFSIGGGYATIPLIQAQVVTQAQWLTLQEFTDIITISQMTPGPLAVNTSTFVGIRIAGISGAIVATAGCVATGFVIALCLYHFFLRHGQQKQVVEVLNSLKATSTGLIAASCMTILMLAFFSISELSFSLPHPNWIAVCLFAICLVILRKKKINPMYILTMSAVAGLLCYR